MNSPATAPQPPSQLRLVALVLEGYAYLGLIAATFVAALSFLIWGVLTRRPFIGIAAILVGIPVATTVARALRALCFTCEEPKGVYVSPQFGAPLHREVQAIAASVGAPTVHRIVITDADNASALQVSRLGVFWPRNTLCLGYPLLASLSVEHVRAVIAHELGHMTLAHGRVSSWVHRTRLSWMRLMDTLERHQSVPAHVYFLFRHYVPRLQAEAAAVSRQQELLADRLAAEVSGSEVAGQTLTAIEIGHDLFHRQFWPDVYERVAEDPNLPAPFSEMGPAIWSGVENRAEVIGRLVDGDVEDSDTHPALRDRLKALHQRPMWPDPVSVTAADYFFGPQKRELAAAFDDRWRAAHERMWKRRHAEIRRRRKRLAELDAVSSPAPEQTFERGQLTEAEGDADAAFQCYMAAHQRGDAAAGLAAGRILLSRDDAAGISLIDAAMTADPALVEDGCEAIIDFLESRGRRTEAYPYQVRMKRQTSEAAMARAERTTLSAIDRFRASEDPRVDVAALSDRLAREPDVIRAFLVTKELRHSAGTLTVLAVRTASGRVDDLGEPLYGGGLLPRDVVVGAIGPFDRGLEAALSAAALIYDSSRRSAASTEVI